MTIINLEDVEVPQPDVIAMLRDLLDDAEKGLIVAVAVAMLHPGHHVTARIAGYATPGLLAGVTLAQHQLVVGWQTAAERGEVWA
jgi:hypothetical protein